MRITPYSLALISLSSLATSQSKNANHLQLKIESDVVDDVAARNANAAAVGTNPLPSISSIFPSPSLRESFRPLIHQSTPVGWGNDPNGLIFDGKKYHLFYQHNPHSLSWGPMHWGHSTSEDLWSWEHEDIALRPLNATQGSDPGKDGDMTKGMAFSGGAILDEANVSGCGENSIVMMWTRHSDDEHVVGEEKKPLEEQESGCWDAKKGVIVRKGINLANDKKSNVPYYTKNGNATADFESDIRDPHITKMPNSKEFILSLANIDRINFYKSTDLKTWTPLSYFGSAQKEGDGLREHTPILTPTNTTQVEGGVLGKVWECPDLIIVDKVADKEGKFRAVLIVSVGGPGFEVEGPNGGSGTMYFTGTWDGTSFLSNSKTEDRFKPKWIDYGPDNYAGVTYANTKNDEVIFQGWMSNWAYADKVPTFPWRSGMTAPRRLKFAAEDFEKGIIRQEYIMPTNERYEEDHIFVCNAKTGVEKSCEVPLCMTVNEGGFRYKVKFENIDLKKEGTYAVRLQNTVDKKVAEFVEIALVIDAKGNQTFKLVRNPLWNGSLFDKMTTNVAERKDLGRSTLIMDIIVDTSSVEVLFDDGSVALTALVFPVYGPLFKLQLNKTPAGSVGADAFCLYAAERKGTGSTDGASGLVVFTSLIMAIVTSLLFV